MNPAPIVRIVVRYAIGYYVAKGVIPADLAAEFTNDPEIVAMVDNAVLAVSFAVVEGWYALAKKFGWAK